MKAVETHHPTDLHYNVLINHLCSSLRWCRRKTNHNYYWEEALDQHQKLFICFQIAGKCEYSVSGCCMQTTGTAWLTCILWWFDLGYTHTNKEMMWNRLNFTSISSNKAYSSAYMSSCTVSLPCTARSNRGRCQSEQGYLVQGGSLPVSLASLQYLSFRRYAAALGCLCLLKTPFLFPTTRVIPANNKMEQRDPRQAQGARNKKSQYADRLTCQEIREPRARVVNL